MNGWFDFFILMGMNLCLNGGCLFLLVNVGVDDGGLSDFDWFCDYV